MDIQSHIPEKTDQKIHVPVLVIIIFLIVLIVVFLGLFVMLIQPRDVTTSEVVPVPEPSMQIDWPKGTPTPTMVPMP